MSNPKAAQHVYAVRVSLRSSLRQAHEALPARDGVAPRPALVHAVGARVLVLPARSYMNMPYRYSCSLLKRIATESSTRSRGLRNSHGGAAPTEYVKIHLFGFRVI